LRTTNNAKIDASDENRDVVTASKLQSAFQTKMAALVSATRTQLSSHLSANGATALSQFIQDEKKHMTISPLDATLTQTKTPIHYEAAAYHASGHAEDTQMGFDYSTYASVWMSVAGGNSNGEPFGKFYQQIGAQGTASPCTGSCLSAYHSAVRSYNHAGGGLQRHTVANQHANTGMNASYVYSWPFDATNNSYWDSEVAEVSLQCTVAGIFLSFNPMYPSAGSNPSK
jgi:hypothetical protein